MINLHNAEFIRSAVKTEDFPTDTMPQIVFAGKSNVGKSSAINRILNRKNFARVGGEPGKTIHINFFQIDRKAWFVDLPGYGYARVSKKERERWGLLIEEYFSSNLMTLGVQIVDFRHKPTADDKIMTDWFLQSGVPFAVLANKSDKLKSSERQENLLQIRSVLMLPETVPVIPFSAQRGEGKEEILRLILTHINESNN